MNISRNFNYLRKLYKVTFRQINSVTGINTNSLNGISKGKQENITIRTIAILAQYFNLSLDEFVYEDLCKKNMSVTDMDNK